MRDANEQCRVHLEMEVRKLANSIALAHFFLEDNRKRELRELLEAEYSYINEKGYFRLEDFR